MNRSSAIGRQAEIEANRLVKMFELTLVVGSSVAYGTKVMRALLRLFRGWHSSTQIARKDVAREFRKEAMQWDEWRFQEHHVHRVMRSLENCSSSTTALVMYEKMSEAMAHEWSSTPTRRYDRG